MSMLRSSTAANHDDVWPPLASTAGRDDVWPPFAGAARDDVWPPL
jgi:hypothetical protein